MILADTSVWVDHLNGRPTLLKAALQEQLVIIHPFVIGELGCANLPSRKTTLGLLESLPRARVVTHEEVMALVDLRRIMGVGVGYIDAHLLASVLVMESARLLTTDKRLAAVAEKLKIRYEN